MPGIWTDEKFRFQLLSRASSGLAVLGVMLAGDPKRRNGNSAQIQMQNGRPPIPQRSSEFFSIVIRFVSRQRILPAAEHRLRVPCFDDGIPLLRFESLGPRFIELLPSRLRRRDTSRHEYCLRNRMCLHQVQRQPRSHRVAEEDVLLTWPNRVERIAGKQARRANVESGIAQKIPIGTATQESMEAPDHAHSSSYLCQTRRVASGSGISSVTSMLHIFAHESK